MATSIIKRSGKKEQYQGYKIEEAIRKAFHSSGTAYNRSIYEEVEAKLSHQDSAHVEEIQDMIERALFRSGYFDTAKAFITYRFLHKMQREQLGGLYSGNTYVDCKQTVEEYIGQSDWRLLSPALAVSPLLRQLTMQSTVPMNSLRPGTRLPLPMKLQPSRLPYLPAPIILR